MPFLLIIFGIILLAVGAAAFANINTPTNDSIESPTDDSIDENPIEETVENPPTKINSIEPFLDVIAFSEGADYDTLVGGGTFNDYSDHPANLGWNGIIVRGKKTTAAGRYQITQTTYENYKKQFGINDFTPESQDSFAVGLLKVRRAYDDALNGNFLSAITKSKNEWESFKFMLAGTYPKTIEDAQNTFTDSGGIIA